MNDNRMKDALENIARRGVPENTNLMPRIAAQLERKSPMTILRARPLVAVLIALLILLALSGVAYAIGRSLGYIPGIGIIDQSTPIRVLAEPVSQTRDGITITVSDVVLTSGKTVVIYTVENIPQEKLSRDVAAPGCGSNLADRTQLKLSDGTTQNHLGYESGGSGSGYRSTYTFAPLDAQVKDAVLIIPCIEGSLPGTLPEQWEVPMRFIPAPPEMAIVPVIEITPSQEPAMGESPLMIEKIVETDRGFILIGSFNSNGLPQGASAMDFSTYPVFTDANGQEVLYDFATSQLESPVERPPAGSFPWAFEIINKQHVYPLTMTVRAVAVQYSESSASFEFDAGANPQEGQVWDLNQDIELAGFPVRALKAIRTADGYSFDFESTAMFHGVSLTIGNSLPVGSGLGDPGHFISVVRFEGEVPSGKLIVQVSNPVVAISGDWQIQWGVENLPIEETPTLMASDQTCLTRDSWQAALNNYQPAPAGLAKKLLVYGPLSADYLNYDNYGSFMTSLDGKDKLFITQGIYPSLSPDGRYVAFAWGEGLNLFDSASGGQIHIPNTTTDDNVPVWSPDGTKIAFSSGSDLNLYTINPDGSGRTRIINENGDEQLVDWTSDGTGLIYGVRGEGGISLRKVEIASGAVTDFFVIPNHRAYEDFAISPDGNRIAYHARENLSDAIYISNLDGSGRRLFAQMGNWIVSAPFWSPDGNWLIIVMRSTDLPDRPTELMLVNVNDCRIHPIPLTVESIYGWIQ
ncbi:MAG: PD40 domain-containing protein [Anaerolineales bacterium]|nr:PD40 domain-containing protein [Anaerolineales bacterium]